MILAVPALLISVPWILPQLGPSSRLMSLAISTGVYAIVVYGLSVLYGQTGVLSIAHGALWGVGAYMGAILLREFGLSFWVALPVAPAAAVIAAGLLGYPSLRVKSHHFLVATFAFAELLRIVLNNGGAVTGRARGLTLPEQIPPAFGLTFTSLESLYFLLLIFLFLSMIAVYVIGVSPLGRTLRAIRENEELARSVGINTNAYKIGVFMISGVFAGVAGILYAYHLRALEPTLFGAFTGVNLVFILLLGGARPLLGPLAGAIAFFYLPEIINLDPVESQISFGLLLVMVILLLPGGLVASVEALYIRGKQRGALLVGAAAAAPVTGSPADVGMGGPMVERDEDEDASTP